MLFTAESVCAFDEPPFDWHVLLRARGSWRGLSPAAARPRLQPAFDHRDHSLGGHDRATQSQLRLDECRLLRGQVEEFVRLPDPPARRLQSHPFCTLHCSRSLRVARSYALRRRGRRPARLLVLPISSDGLKAERRAVPALSEERVCLLGPTHRVVPSAALNLRYRISTPNR